MEIIICSTCKGEGEKRVHDYRNDWHKETCSKCKGTGKLITRSYTLESPFTEDRSNIYSADSKIIDIIRKLNN